jgi:ribonuclease HII
MFFKSNLMILPKIKFEESCFEKGQFVIGVDEAGRGPLAGPVVASAVLIFPETISNEVEFDRALIRDSKTLSEKQREEIYEHINNNPDLFQIGVGEVSHLLIDKVNILNATFLAMRLAVDELMTNIFQDEKLSKIITRENVCLFVDGNREVPKINLKQRVFPKGDRDFFSIAAASICAKVKRDRMMRKFHEEFPEYCLDQHKGYGTKLHYDRKKCFSLKLECFFGQSTLI